MCYKAFASSLLLLAAGCGLDLPPSVGTYQVKSDCPGAKTIDGQLEINEEFGRLLAVVEVKNAVDYGFPSDLFGYSIGGDLRVVGASRECKSKLFRKKTKNFIFLCRENDRNICTITFKQ
jgi:hypothetical protein